MNKKNSYIREELHACGRGEMFGEGNAQLPLPPMLMFDRIISITEDGGTADKGQIIAELDITPESYRPPKDRRYSYSPSPEVPWSG